MKILRLAAALALAISPLAPSLAQRPGEAEQASLDRANASLDRVHQRLLQALSPEDQKFLKDAERAWIAWRDQEANLSARRVAFLEASLALVQERQKVLAGYLQKAGDSR